MSSNDATKSGGEMKRGWIRPLFSPRGFFSRAVILAIAFGVAHAAGLRACTTLLSGTRLATETGHAWVALGGCVYLALYLAFVVVVPILLIAAGLMAIAMRSTRRPDQSSARMPGASRPVAATYSSYGPP